MPDNLPQSNENAMTGWQRGHALLGAVCVVGTSWFAIISLYFAIFQRYSNEETWEMEFLTTLGLSHGPVAMLLCSLTPHKHYRKAFLWLRRLLWGAVFLVLYATNTVIQFLEFFDAFSLSIIPMLSIIVTSGVLFIVPNTSSAARIEAYRRWVKLLFISAIGLTVLVSAVILSAVIWHAEALSAGRPYCIQTAWGRWGEYQTVRHLYDLTPLEMQSQVSNDLQWSFYSVLIIDLSSNRIDLNSENAFEWFNWSYREMTFLPIRDASRRAMNSLSEPVCTPKAVRRQHQ